LGTTLMFRVLFIELGLYKTGHQNFENGSASNAAAFAGLIFPTTSTFTLVARVRARLRLHRSSHVPYFSIPGPPFYPLIEHHVFVYRY
jgi:hypothetical protein